MERAMNSRHIGATEAGTVAARRAGKTAGRRRHMKIEDANARLAKLFDHSIVRPDATREEVLHFAETAVRLKTATLTVQPYYIRYAAELLKGSGVLLGTVVGFPHGNETSCMKGYQAKAVLDLGAEEIDMVMNNSRAEEFGREIVYRRHRRRSQDRTGRQGQSNNGKLLPYAGRETTSLQMDRPDRGSFCEDIDSLWRRGRYSGRCSADVSGSGGEMPGQGRRRHPQDRRDPGIPESRGTAVWFDPDRSISAGIPGVAGGQEGSIQRVLDLIHFFDHKRNRLHQPAKSVATN